MTRISDIVTISPIPKANFSTVPLLTRDYLLAYLSDIVTFLPSSRDIVTMSDKDCINPSGGQVRVEDGDVRAEDVGWGEGGQVQEVEQGRREESRVDRRVRILSQLLLYAFIFGHVDIHSGGKG